MSQASKVLQKVLLAMLLLAVLVFCLVLGVLYSSSNPPIRISTVLRFDGCAFFFSSRRRHTRFKCDSSSDVCSSDLGHALVADASTRMAAAAAARRHRSSVTRAWPPFVRPRARDSLFSVAASPRGGQPQPSGRAEIGRASCRERG